MSEKPKSILDVIYEHKEKACYDAEYEAASRIRNLRDELKNQLARVEAMEKKLEAITTAVAMEMTVLPDDREECSVCGTVGEHTPDCLVATIHYILATPAEVKSEDKDYGTINGPVNSDGPITAETN